MADNQMAKLEDILMQYEVTIAEANDLVVLYDYEIVIIADDSGSMMTRADGKTTRWDELKDTLGLIVEIGTCFDESGVDIYFMNRPKLEGVKSAYDENFVQAFQNKANGSTPMSRTLKTVVNEADSEKPVLLFILTDGMPDEGPEQFAAELEKLVKKRSTSKTFKVQIMACTSDDAAVGYLDDLDYKLTELDCTDDYRSERDQVLKSKRMTKFTRGDWALKAMLGPVSIKFDAWDETSRRSMRAKKGGNADCCAGCTLQ